MLRVPSLPRPLVLLARLSKVAAGTGAAGPCIELQSDTSNVMRDMYASMAGKCVHHTRAARPRTRSGLRMRNPAPRDSTPDILISTYFRPGPTGELLPQAAEAARPRDPGFGHFLALFRSQHCPSLRGRQFGVCVHTVGWQLLAIAKVEQTETVMKVFIAICVTIWLHCVHVRTHGQHAYSIRSWAPVQGTAVKAQPPRPRATAAAGIEMHLQV